VAPRVLEILCAPEIDPKAKYEYHAVMVRIKLLRMGLSDELLVLDEN
jgi:hypothetical protein